MILSYVLAGVIVVAAGIGLSRAQPIHALLWLMVSLLGVACLLGLVGASLAAGLEAVIYVGTIMVFFLLVVMLLNWRSSVPTGEPRRWRWAGVAALIGTAIVLAAEIVALAHPGLRGASGESVTDGTRALALTLFSENRPAVELASMLLLAGLVLAHELSALAQREQRS